MTILRSRRPFVSMLTAIVLAASLTGLAKGGSTQHRYRERSAVVHFTKWITSVVPAVPAEATPSRFLMAGVVGGDLAGAFVGEVLNRRVSTPGTITTQVVALDAIYEVQAGDHSFTALIHGGQSNGKGLLDGVILTGWRTGARVHVEFDQISSCAGNPAGPCFQGTIRILRDSEDSDD